MTTHEVRTVQPEVNSVADLGKDLARTNPAVPSGGATVPSRSSNGTSQT